MQAGFGPVLPEIEKGARIKVVSGGAMLAPQTVYTTKADIRTVKDLVGRTVGTGAMGAALHQKMVALLRKKGVDDKSVKFVNIGSSANIFKAVVAGQVDAGPGRSRRPSRYGQARRLHAGRQQHVDGTCRVHQPGGIHLGCGDRRQARRRRARHRVLRQALPLPAKSAVEGGVDHDGCEDQENRRSRRGGSAVEVLPGCQAVSAGDRGQPRRAFAISRS